MDALVASGTGQGFYQAHVTCLVIASRGLEDSKSHLTVVQFVVAT